MVEFKKEHTKAEWIAMFEKAKKLALTKYKDEWRIIDACVDVGIFWAFFYVTENNATFNARGGSVSWLTKEGNTDERVAAVFDNSIAAIKRSAPLSKMPVAGAFDKSIAAIRRES